MLDPGLRRDDSRIQHSAKVLHKILFRYAFSPALAIRATVWLP